MMQVLDVQKKMSEVKALLDECWFLADRVVKGNVGKQQYVEQNKKVESKLEKMLQDISSIVMTL